MGLRFTCCPWSHELWPKKIQASVAYHQIPSGFLANGHFPLVSRQSRLSPNDKVDNEVIPEYMHRYPGIYLTVEENPENLS